MEIGIFQLLSQPEGLTDREVIEQAFWEVDAAEAGGFGMVWVTEHHLSEYGLVGVPSVYAAAVAQRTRRIRIGYGVAVLPLHHPIRLAEEIAWVDHLSQGRLWVGVGPGFSPYEFTAFGVPLDDRYDRVEEATAIVRGLLANETFSYQGRYWSFPEVRLKPRPYTRPHPPILLASSSEASLERAARLGMPALIGFRPNEEIGRRLAVYRAARLAAGIAPIQVEDEVRRIGVLRRIHVAETDAQARAEAIPALLWYAATSKRIHASGVVRDAVSGARIPVGTVPQAGALPDGSRLASTDDEVIRQSEGGLIAGSPATVLRELRALEAVGVGHVIGWFSFGNLPYPAIQRSMRLLADEVLPHLG